jgi:DNA-binding CsgD family transcriptional regulator
MARRNMKRIVLIAGGVTLLALALIAGAVIVKLPKIAATGTMPTAQASTNSPAQTTIQGTTKTDQPAKVVPQPTSAAKVAAQPTSAANVNTQGPAAPIATGNGQQKTTTNGNQPTATMPAATVGMFEQPLKQYGASIQRMVAQGLNISNKQLAMQLQAGKHLKDIAQAQGVSNNQLQTLLATSIQSGFGPAVQIGQLSQAQVSSFVRQAQQNPVLLEQTLSVTPPQPSHW